MTALGSFLGLLVLLIFGFLNGFSCEEIQLKAEHSGTYSISFYSKGASFSGTCLINVNGTSSGDISFNANSPASPFWINFAASLGDTISIQILNPIPFSMYYWIYNEANGGGRRVYDSGWTTFIPKNNCPSGECLFFVSRPSGESYPESVSVRFFNQNNQTLLVYNGVGTQSFFASSSDTITSIISVPVIGQGQYMYRLSVGTGYDVDFYYYAYGTNAIVPNDQPPTVSFVAPTNGDVIKSSTIPIQLVSTPISGLYDVLLVCPIGGVVIRQIYSNTLAPQRFSIPAGNFRGPCTLSIIGPVPGSNTVLVDILLPIAFVLPSNNARFSMNSDITVSLTSSPILAETVSVNQICGETTTTYENVQVGFPFLAWPPLNYIGSCIFSTPQTLIYRASTNNRTVTLTGSVSITAPIPGTLIPANSVYEVFLTSTPSSGSFTVRLNCGSGISVDIAGILSNVAQPFAIPSNFYGTNCIFSILVTASDHWEVTGGSVATTITQPVSFSLPLNQSTFDLNSQVPVKLSSFAVSGGILVSVNQDCGGTTDSYDNIQVGVEFMATPPNDYAGTCTFSSTANQIFQASTVDPVVVLGPSVTITTPTSGALIPANADYSIFLTSSPTSGTFTVQLDCGPGLVSTNNAINSNVAQNFFIPSNFYGSDCVFSVIAPLTGWTYANTVTTTVTQPVSFTLPEDQSEIFLNSPIRVKLTSTASSNSVLVTVNQVCGSITTPYPDVQVGTEFDALPPTNYTGTCTFSSAANQFYQASTGNPTVTILPLTGEVTITTPIDGAVISSGGSTSILLTSTPVSGTFTVQLNCGGEMITSATGIASNIAQNFVIPNYFYGSACVFSITAPLNEWSVTNTVTVEVKASLSPTGGKLYPITQGQAIKFAKLLGSGFNTFAVIQNDN